MGIRVIFRDEDVEFTEKDSRQFRKFSAIVLALLFATSLFVVALINTYKVYHLQKEFDVLKELLNKSRNHNFEETVHTTMRQEFQDIEETAVANQENMDNKIAKSLDDYYYDENGKFIEENYDSLESIGKSAGIKITSKGSQPSIRSKRNVIGATQDGIIVNSESYANRKQKNNTMIRKLTTNIPIPARPSSFGNSWTTSYFATRAPKTHVSSPVSIRRSRVMHHEDKSKAFKQVIKKSSLKSGDIETTSSNEQPYNTDSELTIIRDDSMGRRRYRPRQGLETLDETHPRTGRIKPLPTVHFSGDTSKYVVGQHANFNGNGHLRHAQRTFVDWKPTDWVSSTGMSNHFSMDEGVLTIKESGVYFIYAQIYYLDEHDVNGFRVYKNSDTVLQCTVSAHSQERRLKGNTCYTAGAEYLAEGDRVSLGDISEGRYSLFEQGKSFFGVIKLGDVRVK